MGRSSRLVRMRLLVACTVFAMVFAGMPAVAFGATGTITGTITGEGAPLAGVRVYGIHAATGVSAGFVETGANGSYTLSGLAPGDYKLRVYTDDYNVAHDTDFLIPYYPHAQTVDAATPVTVPDGGTVAGIDVNVRAGGSISGTVTSPDGPLAAVVRILWPGDPSRYATVGAASDGTYSCDGLWPGDYLVEYRYSDGLEFYNEVLTVGAATPVHVDYATPTTGIDCYLDYKGSISGTVTVGGVGIEGIGVTAQRLNTSITASAVTGPGGEYQIDDLGPGTYRVTFNPVAYNSAHGTSYLTEYYRDTHDSYLTTPVTVSQAQDTPGIDAALEIGGRIAGTATRGGVVYQTIPVSILDATTGLQVWSGNTTNDGSYLSAPLAPGQYKVCFTGGLTSIGRFLTEFYNNAHTEDAAALVSVSTGVTTSGIDANLEIATLLHGYVFGDWEGLEGVSVEVRSAGTHELVASVMSGADGEFTFYGLPVGTYIVRFDPSDYNAGHGTTFASEYYGETRNVAEAETVTLQEGTAGEDIGVQLTSPQTGLSGTVTDLTGVPIEDIEVWIFDADTDELVDYAYTDAAGGYSVSDLPAGSYVVEYVPYELNQLSDAVIVGEWYNNAIRRENAAEVTLVHGQMTPNVNAALTVLMPVYRFYNVITGTHFYTPSYDEAIMVIDELYETFEYEGIAYYTNPGNNRQPLYRFYNRKTGSHFYTADSAEAANIMATLSHTYSFDGQTYAVNQSPVPNSIPVYRFYNVRQGSHFYTADTAERDTVIARFGGIFQYEGPCFYLGQ